MSTQPEQPSDEVSSTAAHQPAPKPAKPRLLQDGRDMFWSMAPLILACIVLAGLVGTCSLQLNGPRPGKTPSYDVVTALQADADTLGFPIRLPALPDGWQANSGARNGLEVGRTDPDTGEKLRAKVSTVGYLSPGGRYLSINQSNADEDALVRFVAADAAPTGVHDVDGVRWIVYQGGQHDEPVWTTRLGGTQLAITGAGSVEDFRTLAVATQSQSPLTPR